MRNLILLVLFLSTAFITTCCEPVHEILLANKSRRSINVISPELQYGIDVYPDTVLPADFYPTNTVLGYDSTYIIYESLSGWHHVISNKDFVSVYIFDKDTIEFYSWDTVVKYNMVLQRYDIGINEINELCINKYVSLLFFPPTEAMKNIHMWPPYGTYDGSTQKKF